MRRSRLPWPTLDISLDILCLQLGDGRAVLLGEIVDRHGVRRDVQLKGSVGPLRFSRRGDGRAALGPVLREIRCEGGNERVGHTNHTLSRCRPDRRNG